jgi:hypothetical protein
MFEILSILKSIQRVTGYDFDTIEIFQVVVFASIIYLHRMIVHNRVLIDEERIRYDSIYCSMN